MLAAAVARPAELPVPIPPATNILARVNKAHPRLLATAADFTRLKARIAADAQLQSWQSRLQEEGRQLLEATPSRYEKPDGLRLLATSRRVVERVYILALLYRLDGDPRYAQRAWQELNAAAAFPDWNTRHFLDTAEMTHAFAIGYDWLYDAWTPEQRATLQQAIVTKGLEPALKLYRAQSYWTRFHHNWNQVCNGGIGMGALALAQAEPQLAGEILHDALESVQLAMVEFSPDGAWKEGPGYWNYATSYNVLLLAGLQSALGTDFGLSGIGAFKQTGLFPLYVTGPLGRTFNYADGGDHAIYGAQLFWFGRKFNQPVCAWKERHTPSASPLDLLWYDPAGTSPQAAHLPLDRYYRGAEVALMRSSWDDPRGAFVGFKAGDSKANHSHLDLGTFVFDAAGVRWAMDLGADDYNLPGYFGSQRWNYYRLRAEGHNTLVINPGVAPDQDPKAAASIMRFKSTPVRSFAVADLTAAYASSVRRAWRGIALLDRRELLVQDEVQAAQPVELWWFMHTAADIRIDADGHTARLEHGGAELEARLLSPADARFQVMEAEPLATSPHPERQARNELVKKLAIHLAGVGDSRVAVLLAPKTATGAEPSPPARLSALSDW
ncbi:MAG TPA: heparinase II/III family protein [Candidatus Acidoferrum sp.]|nr:heparinase II/III family protein [Candidatus Acidoferrum sp.]